MEEALRATPDRLVASLDSMEGLLREALA